MPAATEINNIWERPRVNIDSHTQLFALREANRALNALKNDAIEGAAVLKVGE